MTEKIVAVIATPETLALLEEIGRGDTRLVFLEPGMQVPEGSYTAVLSDLNLSAEDQAECVDPIRGRLVSGGRWLEFGLESRGAKP